MADEIGIRTLGVPEEFGGTPLDPKTEVQTFAVISRRSRGDCGLSDKMVQIWKVSVLLRNVAPRHLQEQWFPRVVKDPTFLLAHCPTEPRGASDRWLPYDVSEAMMNTKAVLKGDQVGHQRPQAVHQQRLRCEALRRLCHHQTRGGHDQGHLELLVPRDTPGFSVARCNETLGGRFMNNGEMVFEDMALPKDHCLVENTALSRAGRLLPAGQDHPGLEESRCRGASLRGNGQVRAGLRPGRPHPDQAPGDRDPARGNGDQDLRRAGNAAGSLARGG